MNQFSREQHVQIVKTYYENHSSVRATFRALRQFYGAIDRPAESTIRRLINKFEATGSVNNQPTPTRRRNVRSEQNVAAVRDSVRENPRQSISRRAQELRLSETSLRRILHLDLTMSDKLSNQNKYENDSRVPCKYGVKCYQKNPAHQEKYKHPPKKEVVEERKHTNKKRKIDTKNKKIDNIATAVSDSDYSIEDDSDDSTLLDIKRKVSNDVSDSNSSGIDDDVKQSEENTGNGTNISNNISESDSSATTNAEVKTSKVVQANNSNNVEEETHIELDHKKFIKEKFLVDMTEDFYQFWEVCKKIKPGNPLEALKDIGLVLVGPFDVLAGRFANVKKPEEQYLLHWRYFHDPPEFQTVLKGDDNLGFHIGYFRDSPDEAPVILASNCAKKDGILRQTGGNIFAAVNIYLEDLKKTGNPFQKMQLGRIQSHIKKAADTLKIDLSPRTDAVLARDKKIVTRTFNKIGLVVPYNRKTQLGYRELALGNKELANLLTKLQKALPEQKSKLLSELQPVFTYTTIAADECDFGTGIELGWNIIAHGVESLNSTALTFLTTNYSLLNREAFGKIARAHLTNRKRGCNLSIL